MTREEDWIKAVAEYRASVEKTFGKDNVQWENNKPNPLRWPSFALLNAFETENLDEVTNEPKL